ncbi:MAG: cytochrome d ubiquinol oxidase subunit II [Chloroflexi bacterium HGW-Chloroflexi-5]|jgi:cytochrome d ubiquinol oxidase subunit II|nr:MAG: cytochrome d ubiquinol oxidase subunit II [Chloroflexi bacterium HGW-Chloroflexi-5]
MDLNILWFILVCVLYIGYFFLEGFDFGVGMLVPLLGKKDEERRAIINTIGPHWDGNEVWLVTAGGATFAAFPNWYATMFSGFYLGFFLLLLALIFRGVAFEFRSKIGSPVWRNTWDKLIAISSFLAAFLLGVVFTNVVNGVPIDGNQIYTGTFFTLLNPLSIIGGLAVVVIFLVHGANFLSLKLTDGMRERANKAAKVMWVSALIIAAIYLIWIVFSTQAFVEKGFVGMIAPLLAAVTLVLSRVFMGMKKEGWAFSMTGLTILFTVASLFVALFPNVMISSTSPEFNLTIYNASSSPYTLKVMTIVAIIMVPVVVAYQIWTYIVFKKRVKADPETLHY